MFNNSCIIVGAIKLIEYILLDKFKFWWESFKLILVLVIKEIFETDIGLLLLKIGEYNSAMQSLFMVSSLSR